MRITARERRILSCVGLAAGLALLVIDHGANAATAQGLQAWGYGAITQGGAGGDVYQVTNLNDSGSGSLRHGILNRQGPRVIQIKVGGVLVLKTELKIREPYLTIDGSTAPPPGLTIAVDQSGQFSSPIKDDPSFTIVATHDIIIHGIRVAGTWVPGTGGVNTATVAVDGDGSPQNVPWDPNPQACGPTALHLRNSCRVIIDGNTFSGAVDSGSDFWCGIKDLTFSRNLVIDSFHPRGTGCKGVYPESSPHARIRITEYANVYAYNGERQPKLLEGVYDYDLVNNIVFAWQDYGTAAGNGVAGYGALWDDDGAQDRHNVIGNVFMPDTGGAQKAFCAADSIQCREDWDCVWGDQPKFDFEDALREDGLHYADNVFGHAHNELECVSTQTGQQPFPRPYILKVYSTASSGPMEQVLDAAGLLFRSPRETAVVAAVRAALIARLAPGPGPSPTPSPSPTVSPPPKPSPSPTTTPKPSPTPKPTPTPRDTRHDHVEKGDHVRRDGPVDRLMRRVEQLYCRIVGC